VDPRINRLRMITGIVAMLAIVYAACTTIVRSGEAVLVINFGKSSRVLMDSGLHWKLPWPLENTVAVDMRRRSMQTQHTEMLTKDKKNVVLLSYVVWSVAEPLRFYQSVGDVLNADEKLDGLVTNAKIGVLGKYELSALASTDPSTIQIAAIEKELLAQTQSVSLEKYGITIHKIGFSRLSLPKENIKSVFKQMRAERKKYAVEFQVQGEKEAGKIRSDTDFKVSEIRAETTKKVATIKGDAEARAASIYAAAHSQDAELYQFVRSLDTLDEIIGARSTIILRTDSEPFRLLANPK
jgi:modulator of FtsH protease HflC